VSAIVGLYNTDGKPVDRGDVNRMLDSLAHRGSDRAGIWSEGVIGVGHRMLWTTPESLHEKQPLLDQSRDLIITADARIDNREELIAALGLNGGAPSAITDSQLILAAYEKWGEICPEKLLGDFAFVIWDGRKQVLFCARDYFGVKPFYYYFLSGRFFVFASEIKALLSHPEVPRRLNEVRVGEYLASMFDDKTITFYAGILRLPPAHCLTIDRHGMQLRSYWSLDPSRELHLGSDDAYAAAFREIFVKAVLCRLRSAFPVASSLSGGLDSSSVSCVAQRLVAQEDDSRLRTFSIVFDQLAQCDERPFINKVLARDGFDPRYISGDGIGPLKDIEEILWHQDEPFYAPGLFSTWLLYRSASEQGVRILLDGHDGDGTVSHGHGRLDELATGGRWIALTIEARGLAKVFGKPFGKMVWSYVRHCKLDPMLSRFPLPKRMRGISRAIYQRMRFRDPPSDQPSWRGILNPDFAERIDLPERYRAWRRAQPGATWGERQMHYRALLGGLQPFSLEVLDRAAAAFSFELRHPFWDKRLVEFCLALPSEQKLYGGWSRTVLRRAMADFLPPEVRWRVAKTDFLPSFSRGLLVHERERLDAVVLNDLEIINDYVDVLALRRLHERLLRQRSPRKMQEVLALWKAVSLALWLRCVREKGGAYGSP
jgi:asparagine synthase (glutamine-hydrolysing)